MHVCIINIYVPLEVKYQRALAKNAPPQIMENVISK